jgi:hypothetical protein
MPTDAQIRLVKRGFDALSRRDRSLAESVTDDFEAKISAFVSGRRELHGREGLLEWFDRVDELEARGTRIEIERGKMLGDRADPALICVVSRIRVTRRGDTLGQDSAYLFWARGDLVARVEGYLAADDGLARLADPYVLD